MIARKLIVAAGALLMVAAPALAGGDDSYRTRQASSPFYVGGVFIYGWGKVSYDGAGSFDTRGPMGGVVVGYRVFSGATALAIEGDILGGDISREEQLTVTSDGRSASLEGSVGTSILASLKAKASWGTGALRPYFTGGIAWQRVEAEVKYKETGATALRAKREDDQFGFTLGGGLDWQSDSSYSVSLGYQYFRFDQDNLETNLHTLRLGGKLHY